MTWIRRIAEKLDKYQEQYGKQANVIINPIVSREEFIDTVGLKNQIDSIERSIITIESSTSKYVTRLKKIELLCDLRKEKREAIKQYDMYIKEWENKKGGYLFGVKIIYDDKVEGEVVEYR